MKSKYLLPLLLLVCFYSSVNAQQYKAPINYDGKNGLYLITVPIEMRSIIGNNTNWLRIKDEDGNDAPYIKYNSSQNYNAKNYIPIQNVTETKTDSTISYTIPNTQSTRNNFILEIANSAASKDYIIDGSNNQKEWYSLISNAQLSDLSNDNGNNIFKSIYFPNTNFKFIRITIDNHNSAPILIKAFGDFKNAESINPYEIIPASLTKIKITKSQKEKSTFIHVQNAGITPIEKINIGIDLQGYYNRDVTIYADSIANINHVVGSGNLSKNSSNEIVIPAVESPQILIQIQDFDSKPLYFDHVNLYIKRLSLLAQFEDGKHYTMYIDSSLHAPVYDLEKMTISNQKFQEASIGKIEKLATITKPASSTNNYGKYLLWIGIGIGVIALFFFGSRLLKDMNKRPQ